MRSKFIALFIVACLSVSAVGFAAEKPSVKPNGCKGPVLCPSYPIYESCSDCCDYRWHLDIGLLYEQPWMTNMIAGMTTPGGQDVFPKIPDGDTYRIDTLEKCFDYSLGVVASIGYFMEHDHWFIGANFDWLHADTSELYNNKGAGYFVFGFINARISESANYFASINYSANIDIYDLAVHLSRGSYHSRSFSYEPFAGVKALWYTTNQLNKLNGGDGNRYNFSADAFVALNRNAQAWGVGPMFGVNGEYHICGGLSIFSDSSIAILYGEINSRISNAYNEPIINKNYNQKIIYQHNYNQSYFMPVRSILGLKLGKYCLEDRHYLAVKIGYDARYILVNTGNQFTADGLDGLQGPPNPGYDIASNGLYVDFIWDF